MIYGCVFCNRIWCSLDKYETLDSENLDLENRTDISHGICPECFSKQKQGWIRNHQMNNGYDQCYNRNENCSNGFCMFRSTCGPKALSDWRDNVVLLAAGVG